MEILKALLEETRKLAEYKEWGVISFLLLTNLYQSIVARLDRNKVRQESIEREKKIGELLDTRHSQFKEMFDTLAKLLDGGLRKRDSIRVKRSQP